MLRRPDPVSAHYCNRFRLVAVTDFCIRYQSGSGTNEVLTRCFGQLTCQLVHEVRCSTVEALADQSANWPVDLCTAQGEAFCMNFDAASLDLVIGLPQPGGVNQPQRPPMPVSTTASQCIAGGAWNFRVTIARDRRGVER